MTTQNYIVAARQRAKLSQEEAAKKVGIDQGQWSRIERQLQMPNRQVLKKITSVLGISDTEVLFPYHEDGGADDSHEAA